ncbi:MAG: hypothetical protein KDI03_18950 [Anaerolineae bacterium]|nr:hypothetical protein [Anaerolineae bacterium]
MIIQSDAALRALERTSKNLTTARAEVNVLAREWSDNVFAYAPKDTARMANTVSKIEVTGTSGVDVSIGVGPFRELGDPTSNAPRGLIGQFISAYPAERGTRPPKGLERASWWYLTTAGKKILRGTRMSNKPRWWQAVQEQTVPSKDGGVLRTTPYITMANNSVQYIIQRIDDLLGRP